MKTNPNKETKNQPVSLAPFTSKMFEKVLYVQIKKLAKNNQNPPKLSGFRSKLFNSKSTWKVI